MPRNNLPLLDTIRAHSEESAIDREMEGHPLAGALNFGTGWKLDRLGAKVTGKRRLAKIEACALKRGRNKFAVDGSKYHWIESKKELVRAFIERVVSTNEETWAQFADACDAVHAALDDLPYDPNERVNGPLYSFFRQKSSRLLQDDPGLYSALFRLKRAGRELVENAWSAAFVEGRILVFGHQGKAYEFFPPEVWKDEPPFAIGPTFVGLDEVLAPSADDSEDRLVRNSILKLDEIPAIKQGHGSTDSRFSSLIASNSLFLGFGSRGGVPAIDPQDHETGRTRRPSLVSDRGALCDNELPKAYCFLLSADLPSETRLKGGQGRAIEQLEAESRAVDYVRKALAVHARKVGKLPGRADTVRFLRAHFGLNKSQAEGIWTAHALRKWTLAGTKVGKRLNYQDFPTV